MKNQPHIALKTRALALGGLLCLLLALAGCGQAPAGSASSYLYAAATSTPANAPPATPPQAVSRHAEVAGANAEQNGMIEITEKLFIAQTNDIYLNAQDYLGKTITYEGMYKNSEDWEDGLDYVIHYVIRYGPGCCGYDGEAGFEVHWDGEWPAVDDWVEVVGVLREEVYDSGYHLLYVEVSSLTVKEERGAEFVAT